MNDPITLGELLRAFGLLAGLAISAFGLIAALGGVAPSAQDARAGGTLAMIGLAVVAGALLLTGCATPTVTKIQTVEVKVPVPVQPIRSDQLPVPPPPLGKRPSDARDALDLSLAKVCDWVAYGLKADPLLRLSAGAKPQPLDYPECKKR